MMSDPIPDPDLAPGQLIARGVGRLMTQLGFASMTEFVPTSGLRVDVIAVGPKGEIWIIECKSSRVDFMTDNKWQKYLEWCDRYFWAVDTDFPTELLPHDTGLIFADAYGGEVIRDAPLDALAPVRRKKVTHKFATNAAQRLQRLCDPTFRV
jgi:hypothetical protein